MFSLEDQATELGLTLQEKTWWRCTIAKTADLNVLFVAPLIPGFWCRTPGTDHRMFDSIALFRQPGW
jgi:hypothetical protein